MSDVSVPTLAVSVSKSSAVRACSAYYHHADGTQRDTFRRWGQSPGRRCPLTGLPSGRP